MTSFSSRLGSWLRRKAEPPPTKPHAAPLPPPAPAAPEAAVPPPRTTRPAPARAGTIRLALDFGTTTTLIAVRVDDQEPRLVPLERGTDWMPSYYWRGDDGTEKIGVEATNLPDPIHSVKLRLAGDTPSDATYGEPPSRISFRIITEAVCRAIAQLRQQGLLPVSADRLELVTNVGCSTAWDLPTRALLRDIAASAGLTVQVANLIEEPVAAAFAIVSSGAFGEGRLLVIDAGGGTLDACVLRIHPGLSRFAIYASGGRDDLGGDRYTDLIAAELRARIAAAAGVSLAELTLSRADATRLWQIAEQAKIDLSSRRIVTLRLPAFGDLEACETTIDRSWFERASANLVERTVAAVTDVYRAARLILDRGDHPEDRPGEVIMRANPVKTVAMLRLEQDGLEHLDAVVLVGGASRMPMLRAAFERHVGRKIVNPDVYGLEPEAAIALGLARHERLESLDFGYPNWSIEAQVGGLASGPQVVTLYDPFAPTFRLGPGVGQGTTALYRATRSLPPGASTCRLVFRRVAPQERQGWDEVPLPHGARTISLELSLLGDVRVKAAGEGPATELYANRPAAPWKAGQAKHPAWVIDEYRRGIVPLDDDWNLREAGPG